MLSVQTAGYAGMERLGVPPRTTLNTPPDDRAQFAYHRVRVDPREILNVRNNTDSVIRGASSNTTNSSNSNNSSQQQSQQQEIQQKQHSHQQYKSTAEASSNGSCAAAAAITTSASAAANCKKSISDKFLHDSSSSSSSSSNSNQLQSMASQDERSDTSSDDGDEQTLRHDDSGIGDILITGRRSSSNRNNAGNASGNARPAISGASARPAIGGAHSRTGGSNNLRLLAVSRGACSGNNRRGRDGNSNPNNPDQGVPRTIIAFNIGNDEGSSHSCDHQPYHLLNNLPFHPDQYPNQLESQPITRCPYHVPRPDGEWAERQWRNRSNPQQQSELTRSYITPIPNRSIRDLPADSFMTPEQRAAFAALATSSCSRQARQGQSQQRQPAPQNSKPNFSKLTKFFSRKSSPKSPTLSASSTSSSLALSMSSASMLSVPSSSSVSSLSSTASASGGSRSASASASPVSTPCANSNSTLSSSSIATLPISTASALKTTACQYGSMTKTPSPTPTPPSTPLLPIVISPPTNTTSGNISLLAGLAPSAQLLATIGVSTATAGATTTTTTTATLPFSTTSTQAQLHQHQPQYATATYHQSFPQLMTTPPLSVLVPIASSMHNLTLDNRRSPSSSTGSMDVGSSRFDDDDEMNANIATQQRGNSNNN